MINDNVEIGRLAEAHGLKEISANTEKKIKAAIRTVSADVPEKKYVLTQVEILAGKISWAGREGDEENWPRILRKMMPSGPVSLLPGSRWA